MNINNLKSIGLVKMYWDMDEFENPKFIDVFLEFYIDEKMFLRISEIKDDVVIRTEEIYTDVFSFDELEYDNTFEFKINLLGETFYLNDEQYKLLKYELGKLNIDK